MRREYNVATMELTEHEDAIPASLPTPVLPSVVSMRQARLALHRTGVLPRVTNAIINSSEEDKITWEYSTEVNKADPVVQRIAAGLNLTPTELDDLFTLASTL